MYWFYKGSEFLFPVGSEFLQRTQNVVGEWIIRKCEKQEERSMTVSETITWSWFYINACLYICGCAYTYTCYRHMD